MRQVSPNCDFEIAWSLRNVTLAFAPATPCPIHFVRRGDVARKDGLGDQDSGSADQADDLFENTGWLRCVAPMLP